MNRVREIRKGLGLTQAGLAAAAGIHPIHVCFIETGRTKKPRFETMKMIAEALGCSVVDAFPDAPPLDRLAAAASLGGDRHGTCRWCGRRYVKDQAAVLIVAGVKIYEAGNVRCLAEYITENTDSTGSWKKHRCEGL